jgi:TetR/AcrR family transcriptional regulator, transcriptional repressor for nem operon
MKNRNTYTDLILSGTDIISQQGFSATGIDAVLKAAQVPKGSFYHYFKSKEEFGIAVIDAYANRLEQRLQTFLDDPEVGPIDRIRNFLENALARLQQTNCTKGCLLGNLGQEMADVNERFRSRLEEVFSLWKERFADCLREAQEKGQLSNDMDPVQLAGVILASWEGAILRSKVMKSTQPMRDFIDIAFTLILR